MGSYVFPSLTTVYQLVVDLKTTTGLTRRGLAIQNQANTIVWVRVGEVGDSDVQEYAFLTNVAILLDFTSDQLRHKLYIRAEAPVSTRRVILTVW